MLWQYAVGLAQTAQTAAVEQGITESEASEAAGGI